MQNYKICEYDSGITIIEEDGVRCFVLKGKHSSLLVDTGYGNGDIAKTAMAIAGQKTGLIITHADTDHIGAVELFNEAYIHPSDFAKFRGQCSSKRIKLNPVYENDMFDLGGRAWQVLHIPGHTPGSIALLDRENKILISGDSVQQGPIYMFGEFRSLEAHVLTLEKLYALKDMYNVVLPCHHALPVGPEIIPELIKGAEMIWKGELSGTSVDLGWAKPKQYFYKNISYYY